MVGRLEHPLQPPGRADALPYPLRKRSKFVAKATRKELRRIQFLQAIQEAAGAWKDEDHPELVEKGTYQWVRELREKEHKRCC